MPDAKPAPEEVFRKFLEDVVPYAENLALHCKSVEDLVRLSKLGLESDAQLRLLISLCTQPTRR